MINETAQPTSQVTVQSFFERGKQSVFWNGVTIVCGAVLVAVIGYFFSFIGNTTGNNYAVAKLTDDVNEIKRSRAELMPRYIVTEEQTKQTKEDITEIKDDVKEIRRLLENKQSSIRPTTTIVQVQPSPIVIQQPAQEITYVSNNDPSEKPGKSQGTSQSNDNKNKEPQASPLSQLVTVVEALLPL